MGMKILITEQQFQLLQEQMLFESVFHKGMTFEEILQAVKKLAVRGLLTASIVANIIMAFRLNDTQKQMVMDTVEQVQNKDENKDNGVACAFDNATGKWEKNPKAWKLVANDALGTVYNAVPGQCNADVAHTASMFKVNLENVLSQRILAVERTFMKELGIKYGDVVYIEGTGRWDGPWQVQDTMNKRFAGMHKIDFLVPNNIKTGKWNNIRISVPVNNEFKTQAKSLLASSK